MGSTGHMLTFHPCKTKTKRAGRGGSRENAFRMTKVRKDSSRRLLYPWTRGGRTVGFIVNTAMVSFQLKISVQTSSNIRLNVKEFFGFSGRSVSYFA